MGTASGRVSSLWRKSPYNRGMEQDNYSLDSAFAKTLRTLLSVTTLCLFIGAIGYFLSYFYAITALLGSVFILCYILVGPVNLTESVLVWSAKQARKLPGYGKLMAKSPPANPRVLAVLFVYAVFFIALTIGLIRFLPILSNQLGEMGQKLGTSAVESSDAVLDWVDNTVGHGTVRKWFQQDITTAEKTGAIQSHQSVSKPFSTEEKVVIQESVIQKMLSQAETALTQAVPNLIALATGTVNGLIYFLAGFMLSFYFLIDGPKLKGEFLAFMPAAAKPTTVRLLEAFHQVMFAFIKGQVLLGMFTGFYMFIIYSIFKVPYAFLLGSLFALAELLPVVGTWIGITIGLTVILLSMPPMVALYAWLCSYAFQTIKDNILAPKVVGNVMGLHPLVIILSLMICAQVAGLLGVLLALPLASALNVVIRLLLEQDQAQKSIPSQSVSVEGTDGV